MLLLTMSTTNTLDTVRSATHSSGATTSEQWHVHKVEVRFLPIRKGERAELKVFPVNAWVDHKGVTVNTDMSAVIGQSKNKRKGADAPSGWAATTDTVVATLSGYLDTHGVAKAVRNATSLLFSDVRAHLLLFTLRCDKLCLRSSHTMVRWREGVDLPLPQLYQFYFS